MAFPNTPSYTHGSTGTEPSSAIDYDSGDPLDADELDYYIHTEFSYLTDIVQYLNNVDSDTDGVVDKAVEAQGFEVRSSDPNSPDDGQAWIRSDL